MPKDTILQIAQTFCYRINITPPTSLVSPTDPFALQVLHLLYEVHEELRAARAWPQQKKTYSFTVSSGATKYPLPPDFYSALLRTQWDVDQHRNLVGPMSDEDFTYRLKGVGGATVSPAFRIFGPDINPNTSGGQFSIDPAAPTGGKNLYFEYITANTLLPPNWTPSETGIIVNKYRNSNGNNYKCTAVTTGTCGTTPPSGTTTFADNGVTWTYQSAIYDTVIADADQSLFDDDLIILGLRYKWNVAKGYDYENDQMVYQNRIDDAVNRAKGSFRGSLNRLTRRRLYAPTTSGGWTF